MVNDLQTSPISENKVKVINLFYAVYIFKCQKKFDQNRLKIINCNNSSEKKTSESNHKYG